MGGKNKRKGDKRGRKQEKPRGNKGNEDIQGYTALRRFVVYGVDVRAATAFGIDLKGNLQESDKIDIEERMNRDGMQ